MSKMAEPESSAVLEVSSEPKNMTLKLQDNDTDILSNNSVSLEGSLAASPSFDSFSTFPDNEVSEHDFDARDLQVRVDNPQKHLDTLETYITFRITTKTSRPEFDEPEYTARRRYNDFLWLRQKLVEAYPTHLVPPLPAKHTLLAQLDRYSKEFILARMALLHRFLNRIANHPILSCNKSVKVFLTAKPSEFCMHRKNGPGLLGRMSMSLNNLATVYMERQSAPEFDRAREYVAVLREKLSGVEKIGQRVHKESQDYISDLQQLHPFITLWSTSEPELSPLLQAMSSAVQQQANAHQLAVSSFTPEVAQPLKEYLLYVDAIREAMTRRDSVQIEHELTVEELKKRREEKEQLMCDNQPSNATGTFSMLWRSSAEVKEEKLQKLQNSIPLLVKQAEENEDKLQCANENLRSDLERWHVEKRSDLKQIFLALANQQIKCYEQCLSAWEGVLPNAKAAAAAEMANDPN